MAISNEERQKKMEDVFQCISLFEAQKRFDDMFRKNLFSCYGNIETLHTLHGQNYSEGGADIPLTLDQKIVPVENALITLSFRVRSGICLTHNSEVFQHMINSREYCLLNLRVQ